MKKTPLGGKKISREKAYEGLGDTKTWQELKEKLWKEFNEKPTQINQKPTHSI